MKELHLQYVDSDGAEQSIPVDGEEFVVGRHSDCDLPIPDSRLSRQHIKIQRFAEVFTVVDLESSNGTTLNGDPLDEPSGLNEGDVLDLGGGVELSISFGGAAKGDDEENPDEEAPAPPPSPSPAGEKPGIGIALIAIPVLGLFLLLGIAAIVLIVYSGDGTETARVRNDDDDLYRTSSEEPDDTVDQTPIVVASPVVGTRDAPIETPVSGSPSDVNLPSPDSHPTPVEGNDRQTESLVYSFMKRIARNDSRPILKSNQLKEVESRIERFRGSRTLAANIKDAASNSSSIKSNAIAKNLQPQFLAVAALARMGNRSGNVSQTANDMADVLDKLSIVLSSEFADDSLLVIAAYDEGVAGNTLRMRDRVAVLVKKNSTSTPREVRTIWFLHEKGEISASQYDLALNFLAIGTITQNPKAFGVNSEALKLN